MDVVATNAFVFPVSAMSEEELRGCGSPTHVPDGSSAPGHVTSVSFLQQLPCSPTQHKETVLQTIRQVDPPRVVRRPQGQGQGTC